MLTSPKLMAPFQIARMGMSGATPHQEQDQQNRNRDSDQPKKNPANLTALQIQTCSHLLSASHVAAQSRVPNSTPRAPSYRGASIGLRSPLVYLARGLA